MNANSARKPGTVLLKAGLLMFVIGVALVGLAITTGGDARFIWFAGLGLVVALIGFGQRALAAIEK